MREWDFSTTGRSRVVLITVLGTLLCMAVALLTVSFTTQFMPPLARLLTWVSAITIPVLLTAPICYFFASKLRELAIAHYELAVLAAQDSLTSCLSRGAFITLVDAYLTQVNVPNDQMTGGLLVIDVDHFKAVNDRYGHAVGDRALRLIVETIKSALRGTDLVGRVGGEEFAVFLPRTDLPYAQTIAERIRIGVNAAAFAPGGDDEPLSVSVGGAVFSGAVTFNDLFSNADERLYEAKRRGRNRVAFAPVMSGMHLDASSRAFG
jgi:diguanylate cyclase